MTTSRIPAFFLTLLGMSLAAGLTCAHATGMGRLIREVTVTVPPAQDHAFRAGIKQWESCLRDHGATRALYAYDAESGPEVYAFQMPYATWAALGKPNPARKACHLTFDRDVVTHVSHLTTALFQRNAKTTYDPQNSPPSTRLWLVMNYRLRPGEYSKFIALIHAIAAAAAKTHWQGHAIGYDVLGGQQDGPQFLLAFPYDSWAAFGKTLHPTTRKMMESVYGKAATGALLHNMKHVLHGGGAWSGLWEYDKALSLLPGKR